MPLAGTLAIAASATFANLLSSLMRIRLKRKAQGIDIRRLPFPPNPKSETRNSKQILNQNVQMTKT
jgi:hypothetical protein